MSVGEVIPGQKIAGCQLLSQLGQGNNTKVYLARHPDLADPVAVKLLYADVTEREVQRFLTQSAMLNTLDHPHIIHIYDFGLTDNGIPYVVMNYAPHGTLRQNHPRGTRLPLETVVRYVRQAADALQYIHEHQLVHRDVKPQNMLLGPRYEIILNDFGTATVSYSLVPNAVDFEGTVLYAAPEQLEGRSLRGSDQYALAIMAYELLAGVWPFMGTFEDVARKHLFEKPPLLREQGLDLSLTIEEVLQRALTKNPAQRFPSIQDFAEALEEAWLVDLALRQSVPAPRRQFRSPLPF
jgi:serine/threonine protein kinase